ncbi:putative thiamine biosynthetic bifunctional enzyme [Naematelia encephala]|uniref:Putative thiamine biosynthetic bifunctional enzyme n=1 Tax=Naematelia encephala TaxID=71784 RepID=A0A1Y2BF49_9TREE|nr:putative thiamine biosynthetic bifunctional enzyme [Naematelia encephala]
MSKPDIDYSLYLVTGRELLPPGKDYYESLEESLKGGVTLVQVREKDTDTGEFIEVAQKTKEVCDKYGVPVLINDRIDVCLAVGAAGIHIGQTDTPLLIARSLLPPTAIIGLSVTTPDQARLAIEHGADYVGIGPVWYTTSKDLKGKLSIGPEGAGAILEVLAESRIPAVAIGGIHPPNLPFLFHASIAPDSRNYLAGIAVISDIVSSLTPETASRGLKQVIDSFLRSRSATKQPKAVFATEVGQSRTVEGFLDTVAELMVVVKKETPLIHQITNNVVINDSANATLAVGASPIMATHPKDVKDLSPAIGALLINFGTISDKEGMLVAGRQANVNRKPLVFDPVAVGGTAHRRDTSKELLSHWQPTVIKGNAAEIGALAGSSEVATRGVDSVGSSFKDPAALVKSLARRRGAIIVLTGESDYISDGETVLKASNGHSLLGHITGSGCMTGTLIATFCAGARLSHLATKQVFEGESMLVQGDMLAGALAGVLVMTVAADVAAAREDVRGPGTFRAALLDELYNLTPEVLKQRAKIEIL